MNRLDKVIFFSTNDAAGPYMLRKAELVLSETHDFPALSINSLLEFYHIHKYFENNLFLSHWTDEQKKGFRDSVELARIQLRKYFIKISSDVIAQQLNNLDFDDREFFWELFRFYESYKRISRPEFLNIIKSNSSHIRYVLRFKQLVDYYNNEIREFLLDDTQTAELLLAQFEESHNNDFKEYIFPKSLTDQDKNKIIEAYLDSEEPNLNYVCLVRNSKHLKLRPKILLKAKQKAKALEEHYFNDENSIKFSVSSSLKMDQVEPVTLEIEGDEKIAIYGGLYFDSLHLDIDLFDVFNILFDYTDHDGLIRLVNKESEMDNLEKIFMHGKSEYLTGIEFGRKNMQSLSQLGILAHYLERKGRSIESLIESFVKQSFVSNFKMEGLIFNVPNPTASPSDKIKLLAPELEYLLKQFKNFVSDGHIDHELLQIDSSPVFFGEISSLLEKKYIISNHPKIKKLQYYFFDSHSILVGRQHSNDARNFFQIIMTEKLAKQGLEKYQQNYIDLIIKEGFLLEDESGQLKIADLLTTFIAGQLRKNGCLSYWHYPVSMRVWIDKLIADNILVSTNKLFSQEEIGYINYYLNKKEFSNGMDLRNKYLHGSNDRTLDVQRMDYLYFLRTIILIILKLKDDLELNAIHKG